MGNYTHTAESFLEAGNAQNLADTIICISCILCSLASLFILSAAKLQNIFGWVSL